jgi:hypothetical protein
MKILRYIVTDQGLVLIVDQTLSVDGLIKLRADFDEWARVSPEYHYPIMVLPGDVDTQVVDLRMVADPGTG